MSPSRGPDLTTAYAHCRGVARREAKNFYYGFLALPSHKRDAMCAVYAFMRRADDIADDEQFTVAERRVEMQRWLASWKHFGKELPESPDAATPTVPAETRPEDALVFLAVADVQRQFGVSDDLLDQLVQGTTMDLNPEPLQGVLRVTVQGHELDQYQTVEALEGYCYLVASVVGLVTIRIFGVTDPQADRYAVDLGLAFQLTNILRDVKEDAERRRIYLPQEMLEYYGLRTEDVLHAASAGVLRPDMQELLSQVALRAEHLYASEERLIPLLEPDSRAAMRVLVTIYHLLLKKIAAKKYQVFRRRISVAAPRKLLVLAQGLAGASVARFRTRREDAA